MLTNNIRMNVGTIWNLLSQEKCLTIREQVKRQMSPYYKNRAGLHYLILFLFNE